MVCRLRSGWAEYRPLALRGLLTIFPAIGMHTPLLLPGVTVRLSTRECAMVLLDLLIKFGPLGRRGLLERGILSAGQLDRALRCLREAGAIRRSVDSKMGGGGVVYEQTGITLDNGDRRNALSDASIRHSNTVGDCFSGLLEAWDIRAPVSQCGVSSVVRDGFSREEERDLNAIAARRHKYRGKGRRKARGPMLLDDMQ